MAMPASTDSSSVKFDVKHGSDFLSEEGNLNPTHSVKTPLVSNKPPAGDVNEKAAMIYTLCSDLFKTSPFALKDVLDTLLNTYNLAKSSTSRDLTKDFSAQTSDEAVPKDTFSTQTSDEVVQKDANYWNTASIAEDVAALANNNLEQNGMVYDHSTGLYYDRLHQCHYNPTLKLYYFHQTGAYYYYDVDSQSLKFHSVVRSSNNNHSLEPVASAGENQETEEEGDDKETIDADDTEEEIEDLGDQKAVAYHENSNPIEIPSKIEPNNSSKSPQAINNSENEKEDGECSDSDEESKMLPSGPVVIESGPKPFEPDHSKHIAPCMRLLIIDSLHTDLNPGVLFIVTCTGGTLGREGNHDVLISEPLVSKLHLRFQYVFKNGRYFYEIIDEGSRNGTYINGKKLGASKQPSEPEEITHGTLLTVGSTNLLCHIHPKDETCPECEAYTYKPDDVPSHIKSLHAEHAKTISEIKKKFGIRGQNCPRIPRGYQDRAALRRKAKGSSHPSEKTQSSSVHVAINNQNKGFHMMTKMGWVEGTGLGQKNGIVEPIPMETNEGRAGLGSCEPRVASEEPSVFNARPTERRKKAIAKKTLERFQKLQ